MRSLDAYVFLVGAAVENRNSLEVQYKPGEVAQSVRCLPCKPGDQSSSPKTHRNVLFGLKLVAMRWHSLAITEAGRWKQADPWVTWDSQSSLMEDSDSK